MTTGSSYAADMTPPTPLPIPTVTTSRVEQPRTAKKRRITASSSKTKDVKKGKGMVRGKAGRLAFILDLPTEIILEIYSYLLPVDVLNLSFVDKELRARLTSPSSVSIWVTARQNVPGMPECPVDFTEWGYTRFLFLKTCQLCGGIARGLLEMPFLRIRLCSKCHKKECWNGRSLFEKPGDSREWKLIPRSVETYYHHSMDLVREFDYPRRHNVVYRPALMRLRKRLAEMHGAQREAYVAERLQFIEKVMDHAMRLSKWLRQTHQAVVDEQQALKVKRLDDIKSRLVSLGYDPQDMSDLHYTRCQATRQTAPITNRTWPNVRQQVEPIVQRNRDMRLAKERRSRIKEYIRTRFRTMWDALPTDFDKYTYIPFADFVQLPLIDHLLDLEVEDQLPSRFDSVLESVNAEVERFRARMVSDVFDIWVSRNCVPYGEFSSQRERFKIMDHAGKVTHLRLATTVFTPTTGPIGLCVCTHPLRFSTLFKEPFHADHCWSKVSWRASDTGLAASEPDAQPTLHYRWVEYISAMTTRTALYEVMCKVLQEAGLDVKTATSDDLDTLGLYHPNRLDEDEDGQSEILDEDSSSEDSTAENVTTWTEEFQDALELGVGAPSTIDEDDESMYDYDSDGGLPMWFGGLDEWY